PESRTLDLGPNEELLAADIVDHYREFIRLGEDSAAMRNLAGSALAKFQSVFLGQINAVYKKKPLKVLEPIGWPGIICQGFAFGKGKADWSGIDELRGKLNALLREKHGTSLNVTRIARVYDGVAFYLIKPDRLRYWLPSIALRDADDTLADL